MISPRQSEGRMRLDRFEMRISWAPPCTGLANNTRKASLAVTRMRQPLHKHTCVILSKSLYSATSWGINTKKQLQFGLCNQNNFKMWPNHNKELLNLNLSHNTLLQHHFLLQLCSAISVTSCSPLFWWRVLRLERGVTSFLRGCLVLGALGWARQLCSAWKQQHPEAHTLT